MYLGWRCYLGVPGYLDRGIAMHYHTPSRDVPGVAVLLGNPGTLLRIRHTCIKGNLRMYRHFSASLDMSVIVDCKERNPSSLVSGEKF